MKGNANGLDQLTGFLEIERVAMVQDPVALIEEIADVLPLELPVRLCDGFHDERCETCP
jgi:hypothetical protein